MDNNELDSLSIGAASPETPGGTGPRQYLERAFAVAMNRPEASRSLIEHIDRESAYSEMYKALEGLLPLTEKLFRNTQAAAEIEEWTESTSGMLWYEVRSETEARG